MMDNSVPWYVPLLPTLLLIAFADGCSGAGAGVDSMPTLPSQDMDLGPPPDLLRGPGPVLDTITPSRGPSAGGLTLSLSGQNFARGATVTVAGALATQVVVVSPTSITATLPARPGAFGNVPVVIQNPGGQETSRSDLFGFFASRIDFSYDDPRELEVTGLGTATADFNGDGLADLIVTSYYGYGAFTFLGNGSGGFTPGPFDERYHGPAVAVGDFNGDGKADIVVVQGDLIVALGDGTGQFGAPHRFAAGMDPREVIVGDLNGDGLADLAAANQDGDDISVLLGDGSGNFAPARNFTVGFEPRSLAIGDFNGDGKADLATANYQDNTVSILLGDGMGNFATHRDFPVGHDPSWVAVGDFNGDGKADLATANAASADVSVLLGDGAGSMGAARNFRVIGLPSSIVVGDFNGDGIADIVVTGYNWSAGATTGPSVLMGDGTGSFVGMSGDCEGWTSPYSVAVADFNGDGRLDIALPFGDDVGVCVNVSP